MSGERLRKDEQPQSFLYTNIRNLDDAEKWKEFRQRFSEDGHEHQFLVDSALYNRKRVFTKRLDTSDGSLIQKLQLSRIFLDQPKVALVRYKGAVQVIVLDKQVSMAESLFLGEPILVTVDRIIEEDDFTNGAYLGFNAVYSQIRNILSQVVPNKVS